MAVNKVDYVNAGKPKIGGAIFTAPLRTTLPTDSTTALDEAFKCIGYITEDGVGNSIDRGTNKIKAWGGDTVLVIQNDFSDTFTFSLLQTTDEDVLKTVFGEDNVTVTAASGSDPQKVTVKVNSKELEEKSFVFDMVLRNGGTKRIVIPQGKLTMSGETTYSDDDAVSYSAEVDALPDSSGNTHYEYMTVVTA